MPTKTLWAAPTNVTSPVSAQTVNAGAGSLGTEYDNETNKHRFGAFELSFTHSSTPTANRVWKLYLLVALDGTNYEDGSASVQPLKMHVASFPVRAVGTAQVVSRVNIPLPPFKFKPLVWNDTDQNSSASSVTLDMEVYDEEFQN